MPAAKMIATATTPAMPMNRTFLRRSCAFCCRRISYAGLAVLDLCLVRLRCHGCSSRAFLVYFCVCVCRECTAVRTLISCPNWEPNEAGHGVGSSSLRGDDARVAVARPSRPTYRRGRDGAVWRTSRTGRRHDPDRRAACERHDPRDAWGPGADWLLETFPPHSVPTTTRADSFHTRSFAISPGSIGVGGCRAAAGPGGTGARGSRAEGHRHASRQSWATLLRWYAEPAPGPAPAGMRIFPTADTWAAIPSWDWHRAGVDGKRSRTILAAVALPIDSRRASISTMRRSDACVPFPASARGRRLR